MTFNIKQENINYIKIIYKDNNDFSHCVKASVKSISDKEIYACARYEEDFFVKTPQEIMLKIACDDGLYTSNTTLKYTEKDNSYVFFAIKAPQNINYKQDREYFRVKITEDATISFLQNEETVSIHTKTYDISANGVRLQLENQIKFPEDVQIILHFSGRDIHTLAKYIRNDDEDKVLKAAFCFADLSVPDMDYISQICIQKQLEQRKNKFS